MNGCLFVVVQNWLSTLRQLQFQSSNVKMITGAVTYDCRTASYIIMGWLANTKAIGSFGMGRVLCAAVANSFTKNLYFKN
jgi:hypothetical protein